MKTSQVILAISILGAMATASAQGNATAKQPAHAQVKAAAPAQPSKEQQKMCAEKNKPGTEAYKECLKTKTH